MIKKLLFNRLLMLGIFSFTTLLTAQVGIGTEDPEPSSALEINSTDKGLLLPRVNPDDIDDPAEGLLIYNTNEKCLIIFNGSKWVALSKCDDKDSPTDSEGEESHDKKNQNRLLKVDAYYPSYAVYARKFELSDIPQGSVDKTLLSFMAIGDSNEPVNAIPGKSFPQDELYYDDAGAWLNNENWMHDLENKSKQVSNDVYIAIGGWPRNGDMDDPLRTGGFRRIANDDSRLSTFTKSLKRYLNRNPHIKGISVDWEYPNHDGNSQEEKGLFTKVLKEIRKAVGDDIKIDIAIWGNPERMESCYDMAALKDIVDLVHLMTFDYNGAFNNYTAHQAPLFNSVPNGSSATQSFNAQSSLEKLKQLGFPLDRVSIAIPLYGRSWTNVEFKGLNNASVKSIYFNASAQGISRQGTWEEPGKGPSGIMDYQDLVTNYVGKGNWSKEKWDKQAKASYIVNTAERQLITYDSKQAIEAKIKYAADNGLYGVMIWEASGMGSGKQKGGGITKTVPPITKKTDILKFIRDKVNEYPRNKENIGEKLGGS